MFKLKVALVAASCVAMGLAVAGCTRTATHESGASALQQYSRTAASGDASYTNTTTGSVPSYEGSGKAQAHFGGSNATSSSAYGETDVNVANGYTGYYGAAFYFPPGTLTGSSPAQTGTLDIMGWKKGSEYGGLRIGTDHRARLVASSGGTTTNLGKQFTLQEGCWNQVAVRQRLSGTSALNEVYLNGKRVLRSTTANSSGNGADTVRWGLGSIGSGQSTPLDFYVDSAFVSSSGVPSTPSISSLCKPLPNVLLIVTDDQKWGTEHMVMPNTMKWFRDGDSGSGIEGGTEFTDAYATTDLCCPSRSSMFSGQYAHNHGVTANDLAISVFDQEHTLQRYLDDAGYRNAIYGKFLAHFAERRYFSTPIAHFDDYAIMNGGYVPGQTGLRVPTGVPGQDDIIDLPVYSTTDIKNRGLSFLDSQETNEDGRPWFLYLSTWAPHEDGPKYGSGAWNIMTQGSPHAGASVPPFAPGPGQYEPDVTDKPDWVQQWGDQRQLFEKTIGGTTYPGLREQQLRTLMDIDDVVDQVFQRLEQWGEADNTIAFFVSDNGYMWREHGPLPTAGTTPDECFADLQTSDWSQNATNPPTQAQPCGATSKAKPYESSHIPMLMRWPDSPSPLPQTDGRLVANIDIPVTVLDAVGETGAIPQSKPMDGASILTGSDRTNFLTEGWFGNSSFTPTWAAIRTATYHYLEYYAEDDPATTNVDESKNVIDREYYNLTSDPNELTNLLGDSDPLNDPSTAALHARIVAYRACKGQTCPPYVEGAHPAGVDVQTTNGTLAGKPDSGDTVVYKFDKPMDPASFVSGWDGSGTRAATLTINGDAGAGGNDTVTINGVAGLGNINLGRNDYVGSAPIPLAAQITISEDLKTVTVTLTGTANAPARTGMGTMNWSTSSSARDIDGNSATASSVTESGALDREF